MQLKSFVLVASVAMLASARPSPATEAAAPALPLSEFTNTLTQPIPQEAALAGLQSQTPPVDDQMRIEGAAQCSNPRNRTEWDNYSTADRQDFVDSVKCLMNKPPSGSLSPARNRYEDLARLHQLLTPTIHGNAKFIIWHRYYTWVFESVMRDECGFTANLPWFDEAKYSGHFADSSIFSNDWLGAVNVSGGCVTNGQFAGINLHIGPGGSNRNHCLQRNNRDDYTINDSQDYENGCNGYSDYKDMAACHEGGIHAWGHNGIGGVMADVYASPSDPVFFLHHGFVDRAFWTWQQADGSRVGYVDGLDSNKQPLTLDTVLTSNGIRPDAKVSDFIDAAGTTPCYQYDY